MIFFLQFDGQPGERAKEVAAVFNQNQRMAMEMLKVFISFVQLLVTKFIFPLSSSEFIRKLKCTEIEQYIDSIDSLKLSRAAVIVPQA